MMFINLNKSIIVTGIDRQAQISHARNQSLLLTVQAFKQFASLFQRMLDILVIAYLRVGHNNFYPKILTNI